MEIQRERERNREIDIARETYIERYITNISVYETT